ncbi:MAG: hypothetical protein P8049_04520, partial [Gemmatimonadota bacterium]
LRPRARNAPATSGMPTKVAGSNCGKRATGLVVEPRSGETRFAPPGAKRTGDLRDADEGRRVEL